MFAKKSLFHYYLFILFIKNSFSIVARNLPLQQQQQQQKDINDPCYDQITGKAQRCMPKFENVAFNKIVKASSTCGSPPLEYCLKQPELLNSYLQTNNTNYRINKFCDRCDSTVPNSVKDAKYLTDIEESNLTCWLSSLIQNPTSFNVSLSISFGKKYELTYISLHFCNHIIPDSMVIMKSMDYGKTWIPLQYYSSECKKVYNRVLKAKITQSNEQEAICTDSHLLNNNRIGFSTLEARPSFNEFDTSPVLQDWITATDVRIVFNRLITPYKQQQQQQQQQQTTNDYLALSELAIGGRCKCNGHASKCVLSKDGKLKCLCKHNTAGAECERCLPFHYDRPWARATNKDANECIACNCNSHSNKCRFNKELYLLSGRKSGGVCIDCKHNTAGKSCQHCREGFYRDKKFPITHRKACKECDCHMIGSIDKKCNQTTGQCNCKEGVTGIRCDRCLKGYKQTQHASIPCKKLPIRERIINEVHKGRKAARSRNQFNNKMKRKCSMNALNIENIMYTDICENNNIFSIRIIKSNIRQTYVEILAIVERVFKKSYALLRQFSRVISNQETLWNGDEYQSRNNLIQLSISRYSNCEIPELISNNSYLIFSPRFEIKKLKNEIDNKQQNLSSITIIFDDNTKLMEWKQNNAIIRRLKKLVEHYDEENCAKIQQQ